MVEITFPTAIMITFNYLQDFFIFIIVFLWILTFFLTQYYLLKLYYWLGVKAYQIYLVIKEGDFIHLIQHPSVSFDKIKKAVQNQNDSQKVEVQNN